MKIEVTASALLFLAALLLILPIQWVIAFLLAVIVHELFHAIAILLCGGTIAGVHIDFKGIQMYTSELSPTCEAICAIAGPIGSFLLTLFIRHIPRTAVCGLIHGIYNCIPLFPMDGGRFLRGILYSVLPMERGTLVFRCVQRIITGIAVFGCIYLSLHMGVLALVTGFFVLRNNRGENTLAKKPFWRYNKGTIAKEVSL